MTYNALYIPPTLTVDLVVFQIINNALNVLLIKRPNDPFQGSWALPGGYNPVGETTREALKRIIAHKVNINIDNDMQHIEQLYTFDTVARDPRGHAVSVTYMGISRDISLDSSANEVQFFPVGELPNVAYDHDEIIRYAHTRLCGKITHTNIAQAFLPDTFTLTEMQLAYEAILGKNVDKRNFRKKILSLDMILETKEIRQSGAHRPAKLYAFRTTQHEELGKAFD